MSAVPSKGYDRRFLDPSSRIRLASEPVPEEHEEFLALTWQGGFLDGAAIHFNENLNVLIGGRGTGKSPTVIESLRYVLGLDPLGEDARKAHEGIVRHVLRNGTKISLLVRAHRPAKRDYLIERTIPNPPIVRDESGNALDKDIVFISLLYFNFIVIRNISLRFRNSTNTAIYRVIVFDFLQQMQYRLI